jgi:uncharacterized protein YfaS (alpha-2-macroglobulin family)
MPDLPAAIRFVDGKTVIERDSRQMLHVRLQNVESVQFQGLRVPPLLLPIAVAATGEEQPASWEETRAHLESAAEKARALAGANPAYKPFFGAPFEEKQLFFSSLKRNTPIPFHPAHLRKTKEDGALELVRLTASDARKKLPAHAAVPHHHLGLTYKVSAKSLLIWSTSLRAGTPHKAVALLACTRTLEVFPVGKTDEKGIYVYQPRQLDGLWLAQLGEVGTVKRRVPIEDIVYLVAAQERDVSFIELKPRGDIRPVDIQQLSGEREEQRLLKRHVFTERGIYRPGDTVFFKGTVREYRGGKITVPGGGPAAFEITDSRGEQAYSADAALSAFGTAAGQFALKTYFPLGTYTLTLALRRRPQGGHHLYLRSPGAPAAASFHRAFLQPRNPGGHHAGEPQAGTGAAQGGPCRALLCRRPGEARAGALEDLPCQDRAYREGVRRLHVRLPGAGRTGAAGKR